MRVHYYMGSFLNTLKGVCMTLFSEIHIDLFEIHIVRSNVYIHSTHNIISQPPILMENRRVFG